MKKIHMITLFFVVFAFQCTGYPVLSELVNTRQTLLVKGTYESNDPYPFGSLYIDDGFTTEASNLPNTDLANYANNFPVNETDVDWFIDFAEIRVSDGDGLPSGEDPQDYFHFFARERILLCAKTVSFEGKELKNCTNQNATNRLNEFFNNGFVYPSTDLEAKKFNHVAIYIRKIATNPAYFYDANGVQSGDQATTSFDNRTIHGTEITGTLQYAPSDDSATANPRLFPLERTDLDLPIPDGQKPYTFEIRIFMKNLAMKQVTSVSSSLFSTGKLYSAFVALSDWKENHPYADSTLAGRLGGNLLFTARIYEPDNVRTLSISDSGSSSSTKYYYAVMPTGKAFDPKAELPLAATSGTSKVIKNLPPGIYDLYKTCDLKYQTSSGETATANMDGFPETAISCQSGIDLNSGDASVSINCSC